MNGNINLVKCYQSFCQVDGCVNSIETLEARNKEDAKEIFQDEGWIIKRVNNVCPSCQEKKTLEDWLPHDCLDELNREAKKHLKKIVLKEFGWDAEEKPWIGNHKNVHNWCILQNGYAVAWNENPAIGWSFPVKKLKNFEEYLD